MPKVPLPSPVDVVGLRGVTAIATGARHGCALAARGGLKCWGYNYYGQLGDGTIGNNHPTPVDVSGLNSGVTAVAAAGAFHSCALTGAGAAKCWGLNDYGQLGDGTRSNRATPVDVSGLGDGVTGIAAGAFHSCAIVRTGGVRCWGGNAAGELGDGTTHRRLTPVEVSGLDGGVTAIAVGGPHSCALTSAGGVKCWGYNRHGQLGDGTTVNRLRPVDVSGLTGGVIAIAAGTRHTCALTSARGVKCWGYNGWAQLGDGTTVDHRRPVGVSGLSSGVIAIAAGARHTCAVTRASGVQCWGNNSWGQLGDGTTVEHRRPVGVVGFGPPKATLALMTRSVRVTPAGIAPIRLRCGAGARCQGALRLWASVRGGLIGSSRPRVRLTLGTRGFSIAAGRRGTVEVKLAARGFGLLLRVKQLPTRLQLRYQQPAGGETRATRRLMLIAPGR